MRRRNFVTGRFDVTAFTAGYTRDVPLFRDVQTGIGANATAYAIASEFFRVRLKRDE